MRSDEQAEGTGSLIETLEQTRIATEAVERRVTERRRRITQPYFEAIAEPLPAPPPMPGAKDEDRIRRSEAPTMRLRSPAPSSAPPSATQYSIISPRRR